MHININRHARLYRHSGGGPGGAGSPGGGDPAIFWLLIKWLCLTAAILLTAYLIDGIHVAGFAHALGTAAVLSVLNVVLRPILFILTLPITIMTMGLFTFILNALMLKIASVLIPGFSVIGFWSAVFGALIISVVNWILNLLLQDSISRTGGPEDNTIDLKKHDDHWK
ncbi:MAG: phage holin family protein [Desulfosalsimonadaceae bacterium]